MAAITDYASLKSEVAAFMADTTLGDQVDNWIDFAEAEFNRRLRTAQMEEEASLTADASGNAALPSDFLAPRSVRRVGSPNIELQPISMGGENRLSPFDTAGVACWYSISGGTIRVTPIEAASLTLTYYEKIPALSDSVTTNWLLDLAPDAYYYMTLSHAYAFRREFNEAGQFKSLAEAILSEIGGLDEQARYHNAGIVFDGVAP